MRRKERVSVISATRRKKRVSVAPARLLRKDVTAQVLREADAQNLWGETRHSQTHDDHVGKVFGEMKSVCGFVVLHKTECREPKRSLPCAPKL